LYAFVSRLSAEYLILVPVVSPFVRRRCRLIVFVISRPSFVFLPPVFHSHAAGDLLFAFHEMFLYSNHHEVLPSDFLFRYVFSPYCFFPRRAQYDFTDLVDGSISFPGPSAGLPTTFGFSDNVFFDFGGTTSPWTKHCRPALHRFSLPCSLIVRCSLFEPSLVLLPLVLVVAGNSGTHTVDS